MSILQEYEEIRKDIGEDKWESIGTYLSEHKELRFDELIYNPKNYTKFENWFYENIKLRKVDIKNLWIRDFGDVAVNAILYQGDKKIANIITSFDEGEIRYNYGGKDTELDEEYAKETIKNLIYDDFDKYLKLPKLSKCSKLLQSLYDDICSSDSDMCHIDYDDWKNYYQEDYSEEDIKILKDEIKEYKLENVIEVDNGEYKILCYGDLETEFNDDRNLNDFEINL